MTGNKQQVFFAAWISTISNVLLTGIKIIIGLLFNSTVLIADGVHNAGDVIASFVALGSMKISNLPADEDHPYGHGKAEVIASSIVSVIMALAAFFIAYQAILALFEPPANENILILAAAIISLIWKQVLYIFTIRVARTSNSKGLIATAYDHLADVYASLAAVFGITVAFVGHHYGVPYLAYADPIAGIIVSGFVLKLAIDMGKESIAVLMEKNVEPELINQYIALVESIPEVKRIDRVRARELGHYILVDVRVGVPADLTIQNGHDISRRIKRTIQEKHINVNEVLVHLNPWYPGDEK